MTKGSVTGIYGKLPGYGDFIFRNLKAGFINPWDEWLQHFLSASKEQIGDDWLNVYLTSPMWRFVLSPGVIDGNVHAGVMLPSVDRVGRYFPLTVVRSFTGRTNPLDIFLYESDWFRRLEENCLYALNGEIDADELVEAVSSHPVGNDGKYLPTQELGEIGPMIFDLPGTEPGSIRSLLPYVVNASLSATLTSFSIWMTDGSEYIHPMVFSCKGLPSVGGAASMLDGRWQERNWKSPYKLQLIPGSQ
jgi:type VI secretion system protein ImpM